MKLIKKIIITLLGVVTLTMVPFTSLWAADYQIDTKGSHAFVQFRIQHLGYSWLYGRFNDFSGNFTYDKNSPKNTAIEVTINTKSVDSNHAARDKHLRSDDFLDVGKYPTARFVGTQYAPKGDNRGELKGELTLHGVTKAITIDVEKIGEGKDPWGGYRVGFEGRTSFMLSDFGINKNLGPKSKKVEMILSIEGVRK